MKMDNKMIRLILAIASAVCLVLLPIFSLGGVVSLNLFDVGIGNMFDGFFSIMILLAVVAAAAAIYGALKDKQICLLGSAAGAVAALIGAIAMPEQLSAGWGLWVAIVAFAANVYFSMQED